MEDSLYHIVLRVSALTLALVLLFQSGVIDPVTKQLSENAGSYVATAIGMSAAVEPNEYNVITAELTEMRTDLEARERAIAEREIAVGLNGGASAMDRSTFIIAAVLFILLVLIVLNYVLDFIRSRRPEMYERPA